MIYGNGDLFGTIREYIVRLDQRIGQILVHEDAQILSFREEQGLLYIAVKEPVVVDMIKATTVDIALVQTGTIFIGMVEMTLIGTLFNEMYKKGLHIFYREAPKIATQYNAESGGETEEVVEEGITVEEAIIADETLPSGGSLGGEPGGGSKPSKPAKKKA